MKRVLLAQLPIPQMNFGRQTGNIPLAGALLSQALGSQPGMDVEILPESIVSYLADAALLEHILSRDPEIVGFTVYSWNLERSLYLARQLKEKKALNIIFGGPEVTPDNLRLGDPSVDFIVHGEGEAVFRRLLTDPQYWTRGSANGKPDGSFESSPSPYREDLLEPGLENIMLLETQRGCPFRCGYCYYNKGRRGLTFAGEPLLLDAIDWAIDLGIGEVYLLDPCLSARPSLKSFLKQLATRNKEHRIRFNSEIRAEHVDEPLADLFQAAGFNLFEIGLQSTNPAALKIMNRPTDLNRFIKGAALLKQRGIRPLIDLILGLPGDNLQHFKKSVDFVVDHGLAEDVQVFPLSVLPGTDFRKQSRSLGLEYTSAPPYTVIEASTFSREDMFLAINYAETQLDTALYPFPSPDIAWQKSGECKTGDVFVRMGKKKPIAKLYMLKSRPAREIQAIAENLTHPYQIFVDSEFSDEAALCRLISILSETNPFTPFEVIFLCPAHLPDRKKLLSAVQLKRPHFLDIEQRFLFPKPGNRSVIFTLVSENRQPRFTGEMERQIFWWKDPTLPTRQGLEDLFDLDGVLIDTPLPQEELARWQDRFAPAADDIAHIVFADLALQNRWLLKTAANEYVQKMLFAMA
jgi:Radical SAM superfamily/B12 binding domain